MTTNPARARDVDGAIARSLFLACLLLYVASATGVLVYGDDISMFEVTRSLVDGRIDVPRGTPAANAGVDGRMYSKAGLGQSLIGIPFFLAGSVAQRWWPQDVIVDDAGIVRANAAIYVVSLLGAFATAVAIVVLYSTCRTLHFSVAASVATAAALGVCTFAWHYARTFMTEPTSMAAALLTFYGALQFIEQRRPGWLAASGTAAGWAILLRPPNVLIVAVVALWLAYELWPRVRAGVVWALPVAAALLVLAVYNAVRFGSPIESGYGDEAYAFTTPLAVGLAGFLVSPGKSMFVYAPILIAAAIGWPRFARRHERVACSAAAVTVVYLVFFARYYAWYGGGVWGPRFLVVILPFMLLGLAALVDSVPDRLWPRVALWALAAISLAIQIVSVVVPYVPYQARMNATPELFSAFLWQPRASAVLVESVSLVKREFPPDLAPVHYHSRALAIVQTAALAGALVGFSRLVILTIASASPRRPDSNSSCR